MENPLYNVVTEDERQNKSSEKTLVKASNGDIWFYVPTNILNKILRFSWNFHVNKNYPSLRTTLSKNGVQYKIRLSHFLMGRIPEEYDVVDHINHDPLDNSWTNLRFATFSTNAFNRSVTGTSKYFGVQKNVNRWICAVRSKYCGIFETEQEAARMYDSIVLAYKFDQPINRVEDLHDISIIKEKHPIQKFEKIKKSFPIYPNFNNQITRNVDGIAIINSKRQNALVDDDVWYYLQICSWQYHDYVQGRVQGIPVVMHRYIMKYILNLDIPTGFVVDHINGVRYDNRKSNLRIVDYSTNSQNSRKKCHEHKLIGVFKRTDSQYESHIRRKGKTYFLGSYRNEQLAAIAYDFAAIEFHGEQALTNECEIPEDVTWNSERKKLEFKQGQLASSYSCCSGYRGVNPRTDKFIAQILVNGDFISVGTYKDVKVAAYAYNCAALQLREGRAILNDVKKPDEYEWNSEKLKLEIPGKPYYKLHTIKQRENKNGYKGLIFREETNHYEVYITTKERRIYLGSYVDKIVAAYAFNCAVIQIHGVDAPMNDVLKPDGYTWNSVKMKLEKDEIVKQEKKLTKKPTKEKNMIVNTKSGLRGIFLKKSGNYEAYCAFNGKNVFAGTYADKLVAAYAYNCLLKQLKKEHAKYFHDVDKPRGYEWNSETCRLMKIDI